MLPQSFPDKYVETVNGKEVSIPFHTDFRQWMRFEELITDSRVNRDVLSITALRMIFPERLPSDLMRGALFMLWFYRCGERLPEESSSDSSQLMDSRKSYSFDRDFGYIAAAFLEKYHIDLWDIPYMHWWKFRQLFLGLHDCKFSDICSYRNADLSEDMPEYRRDFLEEMQELYKLPVSANELRMIEAARRYLDG